MQTLAVNNIVIIGAGNVATHLGTALYDQGYSILQVYSRTRKSSVSLAKKIHAEPITTIKKLIADADIYIIAVKDDSIESIAKELRLKNKIVVHTSGSMPMLFLEKTSANYGVLYPLQTFSKNKQVNMKTVPLCIEAGNSSTFIILQRLAKSISNNVHKINSEQRKVIHLAAVFACNFTNHLYAISDRLLQKNKLPFDLIIPLIEETAAKIKTASPLKMQTGPAVRGDKKTMMAHLKMLKNEKKYKQLYQLLSASIADDHETK